LGPITGLDALERRKILPLQGLKLLTLDHAARSHSLSPLLRRGVHLKYECVKDEFFSIEIEIFSGMPERRNMKSNSGPRKCERRVPR
jgi:hypothetical protein